jgi:Spy/CpxP family protein refolding chaperone
MRRFLQRCLLCVAAAGLGSVLLLGTTPAQETKKGTAAPQAKEDDVKLRGQLPPNWGKIGLSEEQKQKIYQIQNKYNAEIARLEAQVKELRAKRDQEMRSVLTEEQKKRLEEILLKKIK